MKNKKLIKSIKADVKKQIKADITASVVKDIFSSSKKELKKLKKQIANETYKELFGTKSKSKKGSETKKENTRLQELYGLNFDSAKMGAMVTGDKNKIKEVNSGKNNKQPKAVQDFLNEELGNKITAEKAKANRNVSYPSMSMDDNIMSILPTQSGSFRAPGGDVTFPMGVPTPPKAFDPLESLLRKKIVKVPSKDLSEERKEEIALFISKLKGCVSKLRKDEKNIKYRKKIDDVYRFSFERKADFDLKFDIDLNIANMSAVVDVFEFKVEDFKFGKRNVSLLDMVKILDLVGFNINGYIHEITSVNSIDIEKVSTPTTVKKKTISARTRVETFIKDPKIVAVLKKNGISNYSQLMSNEDLTDIKGIGQKTASKIFEYINN